MTTRLFTSESVTEGHPDKMADQISDAILDDLLRQDPKSRVAVETMLTTGQVHVAGEVNTSGYADVMKLVREVVCRSGTTTRRRGSTASPAECWSPSASSPPTSPRVSMTHSRSGSRVPATRWTGRAPGTRASCSASPATTRPSSCRCRSTWPTGWPSSSPSSRKSGQMPYLRADGKTQVTIGYEGTKAVSIDTIVVSSQHAEDIDLDAQLAPEIRKLVVDPVLEGVDLDSSGVRLLVNPTGRFVLGGPMGDAGLTGRKIIVDTYGGFARHGGGAFSGKDPSKVDRSAAYAMRWVAKNVVAAGLATKCEVQVAYAIGKAHPVGLFVETFGTGKLPDERIQEAVLDVFDLRPGALIRDLELLDTSTVQYRPTAAYGHFGRTEAGGSTFTWERLDRVAALQATTRG